MWAIPAHLSLSLVYSLKEYGASFCHVLKRLTRKIFIYD